MIFTGFTKTKTVNGKWAAATNGNISTGTTDKEKNRWGSLCIYLPINKKADGGKFGSNKKGNIWLDP